LIHNDGSSNEEISKVLSIELIMRCGLEEYYKDVLLSKKFKRRLCYEAAKRGHVSTLKWARDHECYWDEYTCEIAAFYDHIDCLIWAREQGCNYVRITC
jgi:hypothetical protein